MKKLPRLKTDKEAEAFVGSADLTEYDLSGMQKVQFVLRREKLAVATNDAMKANPKREIPAKKVFAAVRKHHAARVRKDTK